MKIDIELNEREIRAITRVGNLLSNKTGVKFGLTSKKWNFEHYWNGGYIRNMTPEVRDDTYVACRMSATYVESVCDTIKKYSDELVQIYFTVKILIDMFKISLEHTVEEKYKKNEEAGW